MCDYANAQDGMGFNKFDARIGHQLASQYELSDKQANIAAKLIIKYQKQLERSL